MNQFLRPLAVLVACSVLLGMTAPGTRAAAPTTPASPVVASPPSPVAAPAVLAAPAFPVAPTSGATSAAGVTTTVPAESLAKFLPLLQSVEANTSFSLPANNYEIGDSKQILEVPKTTKVSCRSSYKRPSPASLPDLTLELKSSESVYLRTGTRRIKLDGAVLSNDKLTVSGAFNEVVASFVDSISAPPLASTTKLNKDSLKEIYVESLIAESVKDARGTFSDFKFAAPNGATIKVSNSKVSFSKTLDGEISFSVPGLAVTDRLGRVIELDGISSKFLVQVRPDGAGLKVTAKELDGSLLEFVKLRAMGPEGKVLIGRASLPKATIALTLLPDNKVDTSDVRASVSLTNISVSPGTDEKLVLQSDSALKTELHYASDGISHRLDIDSPVRLAALSLRIKNGAAVLNCKSANNVLPACHALLNDKIVVKLPAGLHVEPLLNDKEATLSNDVPGKVDLTSPMELVVDSSSKVYCSSTSAHVDFPIFCLRSEQSAKKFKNVVGDIRVKDIQNDKLRLRLKATLGDFEDSSRKVLSAKNNPTVFSGDVETSLSAADKIECAIENGAVKIPFVILNRFITAYLPHAVEPPFSIPLADLKSINKLAVSGKSADRLDLACNLSSKVKLLLAVVDMEHFGVLSCKLAFNASGQTVGVSGIQGLKFKPKLVNGKPPNFWDKLGGQAANVVANLVAGFFATEFALTEITKNIDGVSDIKFDELRHSSQDVVASFRGHFAFSIPSS